MCMHHANCNKKKFNACMCPPLIKFLSLLQKMIKAAKQAEARPEIPARRKITKVSATKDVFLKFMFA